MATLTTTITSKRQVTIPKELDKEFPVEPGMRLTWSVENGALVARRVRSIDELAGCLKSGLSFPGIAEERKLVEQARTKHYTKKYRKA